MANNNNNSQIATAAKAAVEKSISFTGMKSEAIKDVFEHYKPMIAQSLPKHITAERIISIATTLIARTPELAACTKESLIGAVMQCSILGFEPTPALGQAFFVPFNNNKNGKKEVQFIIGFKGYIDLGRRSGHIETIYAQCVYANDEFAYEFGLEPKIRHIPVLGDRGKLVYAYAVAKYKGGGYNFEVMSRNDIDKIRQRSKAGSSSYSPWSTDYDEMCRKTVVRRLAKYLPMSVEFRDLATDGAVLSIDTFGKDGKADLSKVDSAEEAPFEVVEETGEIVTAVNTDDLFDGPGPKAN